MHIKQIIIQGFKSYKDQTVIEPFSPKHNVIVGRNGSGKSNFFAAIRFVLSDAYTQMGKEERQALLHEGTGPATMSAFVEIIFDNSDDRFPTGKPEVTLRRTIGIKKDEYTLDKKNSTKSDVMNLLESAGFSRSNPYYIVPQGRVTALTNMKDSERLTLLKEVAGTQVYEARRAESLKIMTDTLNRRAKIDELLDYINERLSELEEEKEELRDYQEKDKERRCLQYTIDHREQAAIDSELNHLDEQRATGVDDTEDSRRRFVENEELLASITEQINNYRQQMELAKLDKAQLESDRRDLVRERAGVDLQLQSLNASRAAAEETKAHLHQQLASVQTLVQQREGALNQIMPAFMSEMEKETTIKTELAKSETMRQRLVAKQGRMDRFKSKQERDGALRREIDEVYPQVTQLKAVRMHTMENIQQIEQQIATTEKTIQNLRTQIEQRGSNRETLLEQEQAFKAEEARLNDERKELWREDAKLNSTLGKARDQLNQAERNLSHRMDNNTSRGLAAIARYRRQHKIEGVFGYVAELLQTDKDTYHTAIEVAAGQSLFHYVVDHDETANKLMGMLEQERAGRITFMPLNRLKPRQANVPKAADAVPLIDKMRFDSKYEKAFQQVFGRAVVCPNITIAAQYARSHNVDAITLDGDRSDKRGALTGGFIDKRKSRMDAVRSVMRWRTEVESQRARLEEIGAELAHKDQEITQAHGSLVKLGQTKQKHDSGYDGLKLDLTRHRQQLQRLQDDVEGQQGALREQDASMKSLADTQSGLEAEIASDFKKALTEGEEAQLQSVVASIQRLRPQLNALSRSRGELEAQKSALEMELRENLHPRLEQLMSQEMDAQDSGSGGNAAAVQKELKRLDRAVDRLEAQLAEIESSLEGAGGSIGELEGRQAEVRTEQEEIARGIERAQKRMEKNMQKKSLLQRQAAEVAARIRDLGALPADFGRYERMKSDAAVKRLHKVNEALKKYGHVNKKAFQQYEQFTTQRETLIKRRAELDANQQSITDLIAHLDQRKDEAIERTFKQVSREFATVFETLVPAGRGRLIIQRRLDRRGDEEDSADEAGEGVESYTGVGIAVSFNSKHDDQQRIQQLSGGQKSLCALTLIFAIQRCDPAPFYLFDEIDANLDAQYRTAVAQMLQTISANEGDGQFICTTFRPEMLLVAQKCYGVTYEKKSSKVLCVSRDDAMEFVQGEATK